MQALTSIIVFGLLCAGLHWLIARAEITRFFWSRTTGWLAKLLACPACSGWWLGLGLWGTGWLRPLGSISGVVEAPRVVEALLHGVLGVMLTPVFEAVLLWGLAASAIELDTDDGASDAPTVTEETAD